MAKQQLTCCLRHHAKCTDKQARCYQHMLGSRCTHSCDLLLLYCCMCSCALLACPKTVSQQPLIVYVTL
jgi:hypothetical protein